MERRARGTKGGGFRSEALAVALDEAILGQPRRLYDLLTRASGLPGVRANMALVDAFGAECSARGKRADRLALEMAHVDPDRAPGATELEILPMCGVAAIGARATSDASVRSAMLAELHESAEDLRWRVRDVVPLALARVGAAHGEPLITDVASWMDGFFQATAVLRALTHTDWMSTIHAPDALVQRLDEAFVLAREAERAAERYPGYKALVDALSETPGIAAARFGPPVFDAMVRWSSVKEPLLREAIAKNLEPTRLTKRFASEVLRVKAALEASAPTRRDPNTYVGPTRGRGRKRGR